MWSSLKNYSDAALLLIRVSLAILLLRCHILARVMAAFGLWSHHGKHFSTMGAIWATSEALLQVLACLLLILGLWTRPAALLLTVFAGMAAAAEFHAHGLFAAEAALRLCLLLIAFFFIGAGRFSLDKN